MNVCMRCESLENRYISDVFNGEWDRIKSEEEATVRTNNRQLKRGETSLRGFPSTAKQTLLFEK